MNVELYRFACGHEQWCYTSAEPISYQNTTYQPIAINRTAPTYSGDRGSAAIQIVLPYDNELARQFSLFVPAFTTWVTVFRIQRNHDEAVVYWQGRIRAVTWQNIRAELQCESLTGMMQRHGLRSSYQLNCNHMLYDRYCQLSREAFKISATVESVQDNIITFTDFKEKPDDWFTAGFAVFRQHDYRMVINHQGNSITILLPFENLKPDNTIIAFAGCNRSFEQCKQKFNNTINFGGFPYIPTKNPFESGID